jgi:phosphoribosylformimino-5-aminoimidazole carboxamide ribotide isomerase
MMVIPAVDIRYGSCVRLLRGDPSQETVYSRDPVEMAKQWFDKGAARLHVIDLDGALSGQIHHLNLAVRMKKEASVWIQFGGGIRRWEDVERVLEAGIDRIIMGTAVLKDPVLVRRAKKTYGERVMVALDVEKDQVAVEGWKEETPVTLSEAIKTVEELGVHEMIFTDISRDGTLEGPNIEYVRRVIGMTRMKVFASGGIGSLEDIQRLKTTGAAGCIIGKALYSGALELEKALAVSRDEAP